MPILHWWMDGRNCTSDPAIRPSIRPSCVIPRGVPKVPALVWCTGLLLLRRCVNWRKSDANNDVCVCRRGTFWPYPAGFFWDGRGGCKRCAKWADLRMCRIDVCVCRRGSYKAPGAAFSAGKCVKWPKVRNGRKVRKVAESAWMCVKCVNVQICRS